MLSAFIKEKMESTLQEDSIPMVLVFRTDGKIIGVASLSLRKKFGIRFAKLLFDFGFRQILSLIQSTAKSVCKILSLLYLIILDADLQP